MSTSSVNNSSQANSEIIPTGSSLHVHFAEEPVVVAGPSVNPDGNRCRCRCRDQRATRRFQRATSIEVEFSCEQEVSLLVLLMWNVFLMSPSSGGEGYYRPLPVGTIIVQ